MKNATENYLVQVPKIKAEGDYVKAISPVTMLFAIGDHPSKDGDEPTIVDHARIKSQLNKHSGV